MKNTGIFLLSAIDTVPASVASSGGTITSSGVFVRGVGTTFTNDFNVGDWIFDAVSNNEIRRVTGITSDLLLTIDEPFTADIAVAQAYRITAASTLVFIGVALPTGVTADIDGASIPAGTALNWSRADKSSTTPTMIDPIVVDPTAGDVIITTLK